MAALASPYCVRRSADDIGGVLQEHLGGAGHATTSPGLDGPEQDGDGVGLIVVGGLEAALTHGRDHRLPCRHSPCRWRNA